MDETIQPKPPRNRAASAGSTGSTGSSASTGSSMSSASSASLESGNASLNTSTEPKTTVEKVKQEATTAASEATDVARKAATKGKDKAAEALSSLSKIANDTADTVDQHLGKNYGDYARKASTSVDNMATKLQAKDVDQLAAEATDFVKRRPAVALGALAAVGLLIVGLFTGGRNNNPKV